MTIPTTVNRSDYVGNGATGVYPYTYKIFTDDDVTVTVRNPVTDTETVLTKTTDYTVSGVLDPAGGNVTLVDAGQAWMDGAGNLENLWPISIRRVRELLQEVDIKNQGPIRPEVLENKFDDVVMMLQQLSNDIAGAFRLGDTVDPSSVDTRLPVPAANMAIRWNNLANALENFQLAATGAITLPGGNGFVVETGGGTGVFTNRTLQQGAGLNIANGDGQAGDPTFSIPDDGIQGNMLDDGIVSNPHIKDLTITAPKMADDSVIGRMIDDLVVSNPHIVNLTIDDTKMADDSVVGRMIDDQVVSNPHIVNLTITGAKIGDGEITGQKLGTGTLETLDVEQVDQVISSLTLTPIFSHTIPANTLLSVRAVLFDAIVVINNAAVAQNITFDLRYGGSSIGTVVVNVPVATVYCEIKGILQAKGATNAQRGQLRAMVDQVNTGEVVDIVSANLAVDSTSNQTFEVRAQLANVTGSDVTLHSGTLVLAKP